MSAENLQALQKKLKNVLALKPKSDTAEYSSATITHVFKILTDDCQNHLLLSASEKVVLCQSIKLKEVLKLNKDLIPIFVQHYVNLLTELSHQALPHLTSIDAYDSSPEEDVLREQFLSWKNGRKEWRNWLKVDAKNGNATAHFESLIPLLRAPCSVRDLAASSMHSLVSLCSSNNSSSDETSTESLDGKSLFEIEQAAVKH